jgi:hypothetical protein
MSLQGILSMKNISNYLLISAIFILTCNTASAQSYNNGIGLRLGYNTGITFKHFLSSGKALEFIGTSRYRQRGFTLTVLYEKHAPALKVENLKWFYGIGGHIGTFNGFYYPDRKGRYNYGSRVYTAGIDGILGLEYQITEIPFTIGIDIKPFFDLYNPGYGYLDGALSIRYILN